MKKTMRAIETTGIIDSDGKLNLGDLMEELGPGPVRVILLLPDDHAGTAMTHDGRLTSVRQVCDFFVKKAKCLEVVQEILLVGENEACTEIWTVASADRMDFEAHYPIYDIQSEVARSADRPIVGFRVVNFQEFRYSDSAYNFPGGVKSLWKREYVSAD